MQELGGGAWWNIPNTPDSKVPRRKGSYHWKLDCSFPESRHAIEAIQDRRQLSPHWREREHRVIEQRTKEVVWSSESFEIMEGWYTVEVSLDCPSTAGGTVSDIQEPLLIKRETLISTLNERLAEEQKKREDAEAAGKAARQALLDAVGKLTTDQVTNVLTRFVDGSPDTLQKMVEKWVEEDKYISKALTPTVTENSIEKLVRILGLATNDTIEVKPGDPVYPLL